MGVKVSMRMKAIAGTSVSLGRRAGACMARYRMGRVLVEPLPVLRVHTPKARVIQIIQAKPPPRPEACG